MRRCPSDSVICIVGSIAWGTVLRLASRGLRLNRVAPSVVELLAGKRVRDVTFNGAKLDGESSLRISGLVSLSRNFGVFVVDGKLLLHDLVHFSV